MIATAPYRAYSAYRYASSLRDIAKRVANAYSAYRAYSAYSAYNAYSAYSAYSAPRGHRCGSSGSSCRELQGAVVCAAARCRELQQPHRAVVSHNRGSGRRPSGQQLPTKV